MNIVVVQLLRAPPLICKSVLVWIINYMVACVREETGQYFSQESIRGSLPIGQLSGVSQWAEQVWLHSRYVQCPEPHSPPPLSLASRAWACSPRTAAAGRVPHRDAQAGIPWIFLLETLEQFDLCSTERITSFPSLILRAIRVSFPETCSLWLHRLCPH